MKIVDLIVIAVIVLCALRGGRRGFWLTAARLFGVIAAVAATWTLHPALKAWLRGEPQLVTGFQKKMLGPFLETVSPEGTLNALAKLADVLNRSELPIFIKRILLTQGEPVAGVLVTLNETALSLMSFILLLVGSVIMIQVASLLLDRLFKLPGLGLLNRGVGVCIGCTEGIVMVWVILAVLTPWIAFRPDGILAGSIRASQLTAWLYQHNFLLSLIDFKFR